MIEADPREEVFWGYRDVAMVVGFAVAAILGLSLAGGVLMFAFPALNEHQVALVVFLQFGIYAGVYGGLYFTFTVKHRKPMLESLGWRRSRIGLGFRYWPAGCCRLCFRR